VVNVPYRRDDAGAIAVSEEIKPAGTLVASDNGRDQ
jgi:hypothetical protein